MHEQGHSGASESVWMTSELVRMYHPLHEGIRDVDVCVIGGGISGLTTAYLLAKSGKQVVVLDDGPIASGETERTTAHLTSVMDRRYYELERIHGTENATLIAQSQRAAIEIIESIVIELKLDCDFQRVNGYLFLADGDARENLEKELETVQRLGFFGAEMVEVLPFGLPVPAIKFPRQAQFHVLKYINGLCDAIESLGGQIFAYEHVDVIADGHPVTVKSKSGKTVEARALVVATNSPVSDWLKMHTKQAPYRTYAIGVNIEKGLVPDALYWDTAHPYHYIRLAPKDPIHPEATEVGSDSGHEDRCEEMLIVGGEDHRTGEADDADERFAYLERWMRGKLPVSGPVVLRWSGQIYEPVDGLGFIGHDPAHGDNVYITTGSSGTGMTHGTISGVILTDLIIGRENLWAKVYDPARKPLKAPLTFLKENIASVAQYGKCLAPGEIASSDELAPGEGAIMRRGMQQVAVYRDETGHLHELSATCKHMGATVCWNSCEKTWDCPAHGARYDGNGQVLNGPANSNLDPAPPDKKDL